jgi:hypothetical protein
MAVRSNAPDHLIIHCPRRHSGTQLDPFVNRAKWASPLLIDLGDFMLIGPLLQPHCLLSFHFLPHPLIYPHCVTYLNWGHFKVPAKLKKVPLFTFGGTFKSAALSRVGKSHCRQFLKVPTKVISEADLKVPPK